MLDYVIIEARRQPQDDIILTKRIARNQHLSVGRTDAADLVMCDDPELSSLHFLVAVDNDQCTVIDQNSTNKTWQNDRQVTQLVVRDGDRIRAGKTNFIFRLIMTNQTPEPLTVPFNEPVPRTEPPVAAARTPVDKPPTADKPSSVANGGAKDSPIRHRAPVPPISPPAIPRNVTSSASPNTESGEGIDWDIFAIQSGEMKSNPDRLVPVGASNDDAGGTDRAFDGGGLEDAASTQLTESPRTIGRPSRLEIEVNGATREISVLPDPAQSPVIIAGRCVPEGFSCPGDPQMSKQHFEIDIANGECLVRDLQSSNGTYLNGQRILVAPLADGDQIRAGQTVFLIRIECEPD